MLRCLSSKVRRMSPKVRLCLVKVTAQLIECRRIPQNPWRSGIVKLASLRRKGMFPGNSQVDILAKKGDVPRRRWECLPCGPVPTRMVPYKVEVGILIAKDFPVVAGLARYFGRPLVVADIGCRWGFATAWSALGPHVRLIGFDPDAEECARLERLHGGSAGVQFVPMGLGRRRGRAKLHLTREPACSSLYPPDTSACRHRPDLSCIEPTGTATIRLTTIDRWAASAGVEQIDVMKLDTQGSELGILQGGRRMLAEVRMLEVEVEFNEIYSGQPLFGDIDRFLRDRGFVLWRLGNLVHYGMAEQVRPMTARTVNSMIRATWSSRPKVASSTGARLLRSSALAFSEARPDWRDNLRDACSRARRLPRLGRTRPSKSTGRCSGRGLGGNSLLPPRRGLIIRGGVLARELPRRPAGGNFKSS